MTVLPSSIPASASTNAPVHKDMSRAPRRWARRSSSRTAALMGGSSRSIGGTTIVLAARRPSSPCGATTSKGTAAEIGPGWAPQTSKRYQGALRSLRSNPKTSQATENSSGEKPSSTSKATVCGASWRGRLAGSFRTRLILPPVGRARNPGGDRRHAGADPGAVPASGLSYVGLGDSLAGAG